MTALASRTAGKTANPRLRKPAYGIPQERVAISEVLRVAHSLWPDKIAIHLASHSGASVRTCERWVSERRGMSADRLVGLLRSEVGPSFIDAIFGDVPWRERERLLLQIADIRDQQSELQNRLAKLRVKTKQKAAG